MRTWPQVRLTDRAAVPQGPAREKLDAIIQQYNKANLMVGPSEQMSRVKPPVVGRKRQNIKGMLVLMCHHGGGPVFSLMSG